MLRSFVLTFILMQTSYCQIGNYDECITPNGEIGQCTLVQDCQSFREKLITTKWYRRQKIYDALRKSHCGFIGRLSKVCCPNELPAGRTDSTNDLINVINSDSIYPPADVSNHRNLYLLPTDCGEFQTSQVRNFENPTEDFPWTVLLVYIYNNNNNAYYQCGGSIINSRYILTSAHCVENEKVKAIRLGEYQDKTTVLCKRNGRNKNSCSFWPPSQENMYIENISVHPGYAPSSLRNDIALIRLRYPIDFTTVNKYPICLPITKALRDVVNENKGGVTMSGWGSNYLDLFKTGSNEEKRLFCNRNIKSYVPVAISNSNNAGEQNKNYFSSRQINHTSTNSLSSSKYIQYGIISLDLKNCGRNEEIGVYYNLAYYLGWILDTMYL